MARRGLAGQGRQGRAGLGQAWQAGQGLPSPSRWGDGNRKSVVSVEEELPAEAVPTKG